MNPKKHKPTLDDAQRRRQQEGVERIIRRGPTTDTNNSAADRSAVRARSENRDAADIRRYPTANPTHAPTIDDEEQERIRELREGMIDGQVLVEGLHAGHGALVIDRWAGPATAGWTLDWYNLELRPDGFPFGSLLYRNDDDPDVAVRVGVRWDHWVEQLASVALHETEDRRADNADPDVLRDLERDARGRLGALLGNYAQIASYVTSRTAVDALLDAAGLSRNAK